MWKPNSRTPHSKRLERLSAAFEAHRRASPGRRIPHGLRSQAVAAVAAGASTSAVLQACQLSWSQLTRWRQAAESDVRTAPPSAPVESPVRVLSVVDAAQSGSAGLGDEIELRIGGWHVSLRRVGG
jgi:transposase-like protein